MVKQQPYNILAVCMQNYRPTQFLLVNPGTHSAIQLLSPKLFRMCSVLAQNVVAVDGWYCAVQLVMQAQCSAGGLKQVSV